MLKRLADAERDGDRIYAVIKGIGTSSDGKGNAIYAPTAEGQVNCLRDAYRQAGVTPDTIELIEAHGTGTKVGDATEIAGAREVFSASSRARPPEWCALGSVKSQIGHTKAAAGAAGLIKAALALYHKVLPPTIKVERRPTSSAGDDRRSTSTPSVVPGCRATRIHAGPASAPSASAAATSTACSKSTAAKPEIDWDGGVQIAAVSSDSVADLKSALNEWKSLNWDAAATKADDITQRIQDRCRVSLRLCARKGWSVNGTTIEAVLALIDKSSE